MHMSRSTKLSTCLLVFAYSALIILLLMPMGIVRMGNAASASLFLEPSSQTIGAIGDSFTVNVSISGVSDLYAYQLQLFYNSTLMNGTQITEGRFLNESVNFGQPFFEVVNFTDNYNSTYGIAFVLCTLTGSAPGVNGGGVLITVQFKAVSRGNSVPLYLSGIQLSDPNASPISYDLSGGAVTVIPEFTSPIAVLTLIAASLFAILVGKRATRKVKNFNS